MDFSVVFLGGQCDIASSCGPLGQTAGTVGSAEGGFCFAMVLCNPSCLPFSVANCHCFFGKVSASTPSHVSQEKAEPNGVRSVTGLIAHSCWHADQRECWIGGKASSSTPRCCSRACCCSHTSSVSPLVFSPVFFFFFSPVRRGAEQGRVKLNLVVSA